MLIAVHLRGVDISVWTTVDKHSTNVMAAVYPVFPPHPPHPPPSAGLRLPPALAPVCPVRWAEEEEEVAAVRWGTKSQTRRLQAPRGLLPHVPPRRWWTQQTPSAPPRPRSLLLPSWRTACAPVSTQSTRHAPQCSWVSRSCTQLKYTGAAFYLFLYFKIQSDMLLISTSSLF